MQQLVTQAAYSRGNAVTASRAILHGTAAAGPDTYSVVRPVRRTENSPEDKEKEEQYEDN